MLDLAAAILAPCVVAILSAPIYFLVGPISALVAGSLTLVLFCTVHIPFRKAVGLLETYLRGGKEENARFDVFISYRLVQQADVARELYEALTKQGFRVWYDYVALEPSSSGGHTKPGGSTWLRRSLLEELKTGLQGSRAVLFLVPELRPRGAEPPVGRWKRFLAFMEAMNPPVWILYLMNLFSVLVKNLWYSFFYGVSLRKRRDENWQAWEGRVGLEMGRSVTKVRVSTDCGANGSVEELRCLRRDRLFEDSKELVAPRIKEAPPRTRQLGFLPGLQRTFAMTVVAIAVAAAILVLLALLSEALETVKTTISKPLVFILLLLLISGIVIALLVL